MNLKKLFLTASFVSAVALGATVASSAQAATMNVYTGYADNLRPSGFFPGPWLGDSGVVSQSSAAQTFDAGAVRITNLTGSSFTVSNFQVKMNGVSGPTYAIWSDLTIGAGQDGIFTQTSFPNFDSSDNSTGGPYGGLTGSSPGSNGIGGCSSTAAAQAAVLGMTAYCAARMPTVSFDIGLLHFALNDSGHILDTGNYDFINGSTDGNESINWNLIGSGADRGGTGVPEPATWTMMLVGFAGLGAALRRRHRVALAH